MARYQSSMAIASRGIGKSYIASVFLVCMAILYQNMKIGIASGKSLQSRNIILLKIRGELVKNENIAREIKFPIRTGVDDCVVEFKNGSEIRAITLSQERGGDSARGFRFHILLCDESRLIRDNVIEEILIPMTKTLRPIAIQYGKREKGKVIYLSSAYLKTSDLYKRFRFHYEKMLEGSKDYFVCTLPYQVGVDAGIFMEEDIIKEKDKPSMTSDKFAYEYEGVFVGSSNESYYPYELTEKCRVLENIELEQPKKSNSEYVVFHDVAISNARDADNACTGVFKLKQRANGTYSKELVYLITHRGMPLTQQMKFLRELVHIKFPNTIKLIIDTRGNGEGLPSLFYEPYEYTDEKTKQVIEFPPLVLDNDDDAKKIKGAIPLIRGMNATNITNNTMYTYMKSCFEDMSIKLPIISSEKDELLKSGEITPEEFAVYMDTDFLIQELSNIKQESSNFGNIVYERIVNATKRDRVTATAYGLLYISELENINRRNLHKKSNNLLDYFFFDKK